MNNVVPAAVIYDPRQGEHLLASMPRRLQLEDIRQLPGLHDISADGLARLSHCFPAPVMTTPSGQAWDRRHVLAWWRRVHRRETR